MNNVDVKKMFNLALEARAKAYAPYSKFLVGACVFTEAGEYFSGCNIENSSFRMTDCAETVAIGSMIIASQQKINAVLVVSDIEKGVTPCGACLQKISEFAHQETVLYSANLQGVVREQKFLQVFPGSFLQEFNSLLSTRS